MAGSKFGASGPIGCLPVSPTLGSLRFSAIVLAFSLSGSSAAYLGLAYFEFGVVLMASSFAPNALRGSYSAPSVLVMIVTGPSGRREEVQHGTLPAMVPGPNSGKQGSGLPGLRSTSGVGALSNF